MRPELFKAPQSGKLAPTTEKQFAFVPAPLPPQFDIAAITMQLATAMQAIGELRGACRRLQNPYILVRPLQRNEALTSSAMEGTFTTADHLLLAEVGVEPPADESTREVVNYLSALNESLELLKTLPLSHRVIKSAHEKLLSGLSAARGARKRPGEYKRDQNWIGGHTIDRARFVPPPPAETLQCMDALEAYINRPNVDQPHALIDLALVHYQLETIHPFADGNGRVGRMLISLMAVHGGLLDMPILYVSPALEAVKDCYIDKMFEVSTEGKWVEWINFFLGRILETCKHTILMIDRLINLQKDYRDRATQASRSNNALSIVDHLFERPALTIGDAAEKLCVTYPAAKSTIAKLVEIGILTEFPGAYPKVFLAPEIIRISHPAENTEASRAD